MPDWLKKILNVIVKIVIPLAAYTGIVITLWTFFHPPPPSPDLKRLALIYQELMDALVGETNRVLNIEDIHSPLLLNDPLIELIKPLAPHAHALDEMRDFLAENHTNFSRKGILIADLNVACAMAKIFIYEAAKKHPFNATKDRAEINDWLNSHEQLAKKFKKIRYLGYNALLRGTYHKAIAMGYISENKEVNRQIIKDEMKEAINQYRETLKASLEAFKASLAKKDKDEKDRAVDLFLAANSSLGALFETRFATFDNYLDFDSTIKYYKLPQKQGSMQIPDTLWKKALNFYNAAEASIYEYDYPAANKYLDSCDSWFNRYREETKKNLGAKGIHEYALGLRLLCQLYEVHKNYEKLLSQEKIDAFTKLRKEKGLDTSGYCGDMLKVMLDILQAQLYYTKLNNKDRAQEIVDRLVKEVQDSTDVWLSATGSKPKIILKIMSLSIYEAAKNKTYPEIFKITREKLKSLTNEG